MFSLRYIRNKKIISESCAAYIHHWESYSPSTPCETILMRCIIRYMDENKDYISAQRDTDPDFKVFILKLISKVSFDMIISRVYSGRIFTSLKFVHTKAMEELLYPGYISQREFDEDKESIIRILNERLPEDAKKLRESKKRMEEFYQSIKENKEPTDEE